MCFGHDTVSNPFDRPSLQMIGTGLTDKTRKADLIRQLLCVPRYSCLGHFANPRYHMPESVRRFLAIPVGAQSERWQS